MGQFGRTDQQGRSSGKLSGRKGKARRPPKGEPWVWTTRELLSSPAWKAMGVNTHRLIDFLLIEDMNHSGTFNGSLKATYDQLVAYGLTRSEIRAAIEEARSLGLLRFVRGGRWAGTNQPSTFRLTFLSDQYFNPATNEWKGVTAEDIEARKRVIRQSKCQPKKNRFLVRLPELP